MLNNHSYPGPAKLPQNLSATPSIDGDATAGADASQDAGRRRRHPQADSEFMPEVQEVSLCAHCNPGQGPGQELRGCPITPQRSTIIPLLSINS
jgi:hypothetical protein